MNREKGALICDIFKVPPASHKKLHSVLFH